MEDHLGLMVPHHPVNQGLILDVPQNRGIPQVPGPVLELHLHPVQGRLTGIQQNQLPGLEFDDLAAQLTSNAAPTLIGTKIKKCRFICQPPVVSEPAIQTPLYSKPAILNRNGLDKSQFQG
jgi:hypothetical protein